MLEPGAWTVSVALPEGWLILPRPDAMGVAPPARGQWDKAAWALSEDWARGTAELLGLRKPSKRKGQDPRSTEYRLGEQLLVHLRMMWELRPIGSAVLLPAPEDGVLAAMTVTQILTTTADPLPEIRAAKSIPHPDVVAPREFADVALPLGPALRLHEVFRNQDSLPGEALVEGISYFLEAPGTGEIVELSVQWWDFALGEDLALHAEAIAKSLEFQPL